MEIRNIAITAHVDHGKTTLVDAMLKQTATFRENEEEMEKTLIMDSFDLEREKGITILAKNTAVIYKNIKINIIDTPGHADFGGEVERVLNMASGAILLVDAAEGPLPQTKFVLKKALEQNLKIILVINKIDKKDARVQEVLSEVEDIFLDLAHSDDAFNFTTLYAVGRDGKVFYKLPSSYSDQTPGDLTPLFETIIGQIENANTNADKPFQMLISTLDYDNHVGKICIGKVTNGTLKKNAPIVLVDENTIIGNYRAIKIFTNLGLKRQEIEEAQNGDIITLAGIPILTIGQTVADPQYPMSLPKIEIEEPTIKITIGPNTSPFAGRDGKLHSSSQIKERLLREKETNLSLRIEQGTESANFSVAGRGELHLAVLIETMRREGFELEVTKPQVIYKKIDDVECEPYEEVTIDVDNEFTGAITEELAKRKGEMLHMNAERNNIMRFVYKVSSKNLLGIRNSLLTKTRGTAIINTFFLGYFPRVNRMEIERNGVLVASEGGQALSYGLANAQERGTLFIGPGTPVYEGMIVGVSSREADMDINVCKEKKQTNMRSSTGDMTVQITTPTIFTLEQALDFLNEDEILEVTPKNIRLRKRFLSGVERRVKQRQMRNK